jgi:asparagine synthase (glutamine-hydrolysing)
MGHQMSIIFGMLKSPDEKVDRAELGALARSTESEAADGTFLYTDNRIGLGFQPSYTNDRLRLDSQPVVDSRGNVVVFDGRLDNFEELGRELGTDAAKSPDGSIVLAAFARWGDACFSRLIGDWALALWSKNEQQLFLARDHAGTRSMYFCRRDSQITWSSSLQTFFANGHCQQVEKLYAARFLSGQAIEDATPFQGIVAVLPAHYVRVGRHSVRPELHWSPFSKGVICYNRSVDYESHFLTLFRSAVKRRLAPGAGILAQLSGGMDSSSIVCVADRLCADGEASGLVDTLSFFDDSEPNWDERRYFTKVEAQRGKRGIHIDLSALGQSLEFDAPSPTQLLSPVVDFGRLRLERAVQQALGTPAPKVVLSGIGGDELLGGVPTPIPELSDLLFTGQIKRLMDRSIAWSLRDRTPILQLLSTTLRTAAGLYLRPSRSTSTAPPWIGERLREVASCQSNPTKARLKLGGIRPSSIMNGQAWWSIVDGLPHLTPSPLLRFEYRYPYLDRDLVEFLHSVPRHELVAPGRRRLMMRSALQGIVPEEILERPRKAYVARAPLSMLRAAQEQIEGLFTGSFAAEYGFIDPAKFREALRTTIAGDLRWMRAILLTIAYEVWLQALERQRPREMFRT